MAQGLALARPRSLTAVLVVIALCSMSVVPRFGHAAEPAVVIKLINKLKFVPAQITVKVGDTVRWQNASVLVHTVTDDPNLVAKEADYALPDGAEPFNSGNLKPKESYEHTFTVPGTYRYFCIPHEAAKMIGEVVVLR